MVLLTPPFATAQEQGKSNFDSVEEMPEFPGGQSALFKYIFGNMDYPEEDIKANKEAVVGVSFVIEKDGAITNIKQINGQAKNPLKQ